MIAGVLLAVLIADSAVAQAAPEPKTIIRVKAGPVCGVLRELVVPLAVVQRKNELLMVQMQRDTSEYKRLSDSVFRDGMILHSSNIDAAATTVLQNLASIDALLAKSWQQSPAGKNPKVDALRQRVQNIVDVQRAVANKERQFGGFLPDIDGMDMMAAGADVGSRFGHGAVAPAAQPATTAVQVAASATPIPVTEQAEDPEVDAQIPAAVPAVVSAKRLPDYSFVSLERLLRSESAALVPAALAAYRDCVVTEPAGLRN